MVDARAAMAFFKLKENLLKNCVGETKPTSVLNPKRRSKAKKVETDKQAPKMNEPSYGTGQAQVQREAKKYEDIQRERKEKAATEALALHLESDSESLSKRIPLISAFALVLLIICCRLI